MASNASIAPRRIERIALAGLAFVALALAAGANAAGPTQQHTTHDQAAAQAALITQAILGKTWTGGAGGTQSLALACPGYATSAKGIVETGTASSPNFASGSNFIFQIASVYATAAQAKAYWDRGVKAGLVACIAQTEQTLTAKGIKVTITSQGPLAVAKAGTRTAAYRVVAKLQTSKRTAVTYFDVILVGSGRTISEISVSTFTKPAPATFEHALALIVAKRIAAMAASGAPTA